MDESRQRSVGAVRGEPGADGSRGERPPMPTWKRILLAISIAVTVIGLVLQASVRLTGGSEAPVEAPGDGPGAGGVEPALVQGLTGLDDPSAAPPPAATRVEPTALEAWSPTIFRLGFSFFVGFCLGFVVRTFLKISVFAIGLLLLLLFGLQYAGVITVDWAQMEQHYDTAVDWLQAQTASFGGFVRGYLPSAASAAAGLVVGFKKR